MTFTSSVESLSWRAATAAAATAAAAAATGLGWCWCWCCFWCCCGCCCGCCSLPAVRQHASNGNRAQVVQYNKALIVLSNLCATRQTVCATARAIALEIKWESEVRIDFFFFFLSLWIYLWLAETSQQPISQTTWLKVTPNCNHCNH